ncbi:MAG TPA: glycine oxidase ThiO [Actinocrinis sp.]|nr:glycine oxidase ThiO [Actinocrinis sp.]
MQQSDHSGPLGRPDPVARSEQSGPAYPAGRPDPADRLDAIVIGAGLIGSAIAWRARRLGLRVALADPGHPQAASTVAAGLLAPVSEAHYGEEGVLALSLESARRYPEFVRELEADAGVGPGAAGYQACGTLSVAYDRDDGAVLAETAGFHRRLGLASETLTGAQCRELEPLLAPGVYGGFLAGQDNVVDNRRLLATLHTALERTATPIHRQAVTEILIEAGAAVGVRLADGARLAAAQVVLAAGAWSNAIGGLPSGLLPTIRPVKGQILRLAVPAPQRPFVSRAVFGLVRGRKVYLAPRVHGELVVGATAEEAGFDPQPTAGGVYELLRDAHVLFPGIGELPLAEISVGMRPCAADNAPVLGRTALPGLIAATGHYRNGVLLTPVTADLVAGLLAGGDLPGWAGEFQPRRPAGAGR